MSGPRIPFPKPSELNAGTQFQLARRPPVHLYRMVAHAPALLEPFMSMVLANFNQLSLPARLREAVILRVGAHHRSAYEIHHHRTKAREAGLSEECIDAVLALGSIDELPDPALGDAIEFADRLLSGAPIDDCLVRRIVEAHKNRGYAELALLVGFYRMVATFIDATGIEPESNDIVSHWRSRT